MIKKMDRQKPAELVNPFPKTYYVKGCLLFPTTALKNTFPIQDQVIKKRRESWVIKF